MVNHECTFELKTRTRNRYFGLQNANPPIQVFCVYSSFSYRSLDVDLDFVVEVDYVLKIFICILFLIIYFIALIKYSSDCDKMPSLFFSVISRIFYGLVI